MLNLLTAIALALTTLLTVAAADSKPNIIIFLADDLGYGDLGCFGSQHIKTPHLDKMAAEGMILTDFYSGATVCAPSRCVLMTGLHMGHGWVRGNANEAMKQTLQTGEITVAGELKKAGYATALFGKWGLGELDSIGHPMKHGFDDFYGYLNQRHAHNFYPEFIIDRYQKVALRNRYDPAWIKMREQQGRKDDGAGWATPETKLDYVPDLVMQRTYKWLDKKKAEPFFLYLSLNMPHANNEATSGTGNGQEVPDYGIYADRDWPDPDKGQAAMITRMDGYMGELIRRLKGWGIDDNTLILFTSDNGPHQEGGNRMNFFDANGPVRGMKRDLTDGGIRVPTIVRWPGAIPAGSTSDRPAYFGDVLATTCDLAGIPTPEGRDTLSFLPTLKGAKNQPEAPYIYWESYEKGGKQALRFGKWKAVREPWIGGEIQLFDVRADIGESKDVAASFPAVAAQAEKFLQQAHVPSPNWTPPVPRNKK
ncbi:MAG: arylsulfatase, partial [Verrucomicrobiales bacterium]|nr:arylsulfatase [Verrucomicrobiales bacterium]